MCFLMLRPSRQEDLEEELGISFSTVVDWFSFCREIIYFNFLIYLLIHIYILLLLLILIFCIFRSVYWTDKYSEKLGGPECWDWRGKNWPSKIQPWSTSDRKLDIWRNRARVEEDFSLCQYKIKRKYASGMYQKMDHARNNNSIWSLEVL